MPVRPQQYFSNYTQYRSMCKERGVAMITALMIVAIAVTVIASIFVQQRYSIRLARNFQDLEQTYQYAYAAEDLAGVLLKRDFKSNKHDSAFDNWGSKNIKPFEIDDDNGEQIGMMQIEIEDMQGRFNINNLVKKPVANSQHQEIKQTGTQGAGQAAPPANLADKPREVVLRAFERLLFSLRIPSSFAYDLIDWIDQDNEPYRYGSAETDYYLALPKPYEAANAFLQDPAELILVRMATYEKDHDRAEKIRDLRPYVTVLPTPTAINVNTASKEVLLATGMVPIQADLVLSLRQSQPIADMEALKKMTSNTQVLEAETLSLLGFQSNYFRLAGEVRLGKSRLFLNSLLFRSPEGEVRVIMRQFSRMPKPKN